MLNNPMLVQMVAEEIHRDRLAARMEEAKIDHALKTIRSPSLGLADWFFVSVGDLLVSAGCKLRQHARPLVYSDANPSDC